MCFVVFLPEKTGTFSANFNIYFMLKMQEMAFPGFKFQKFSGGDAPGPPYRAWPPATPVLQCYGQFTTLDPPLVSVHLQANFLFFAILYGQSVTGEKRGYVITR